MARPLGPSLGGEGVGFAQGWQGLVRSGSIGDQVALVGTKANDIAPNVRSVGVKPCTGGAELLELGKQCRDRAVFDLLECADDDGLDAGAGESGEANQEPNGAEVAVEAGIVGGREAEAGMDGSAFGQEACGAGRLGEGSGVIEDGGFVEGVDLRHRAEKHAVGAAIDLAAEVEVGKETGAGDGLVGKGFSSLRTEGGAMEVKPNNAMGRLGGGADDFGAVAAVVFEGEG